ncbi:glycerate kinase [Craterilacuibacter sp. RT1T]|uniref:glycerate kinase n=1 Tax=Craterilacuibacter sp. RT1T TaxID=2942211 RepID=UPI0020BE2B85|nr:glycerate kinase [Craterilacuibacter sp. RT1T]MCL6262544.1 glycerate kinase [Craterilacuibacter sp. RT1T]
MHWLIAPDSFKGSLPAARVAEAMAAGVRRADAQARLTLKPMADGGEGTLDTLYSVSGGLWRECVVHDAAGKMRTAAYLCLPDGCCVIEVAQVVPLTEVPGGSALERSSLGVGELMLDALDQGATHLALALGGSSTNDGGAGLLLALGARFVDGQGRWLQPSPAGLQGLAQVDLSALDARLAHTRIELWSDVDHPLCGEQGASAVFGGQKGLSAAEQLAADEVLQRLAVLAGGEAQAQQAGAGAAGGMGWALLLLGGQRTSGAQAVASHTGLAAALCEADWVLTGEGASDAQTLSGKAPFVVAQLAQAAGVPVSLLSGAIRPDGAGRLAAAFDGCFSLCSGPMPLTTAMAQAPALLEQACEQLARTVLRARRV